MPSIEATRSRSRIDQPEPPPSTPTSQPRPTGAPANDHTVDASVVAAARTFNDRVLYVGMNASSVPSEAKALGREVTVIGGQNTTEVKVGDRAFDISTPRGVRGFVEKLCADNGLSLRQCEQLEGVLLGSPVTGRDELARIAAVWAPAERGESIPSRLVLSGHSSLGMFWGEDTGVIHFQAVRDLGRVFKKAGEQIEDIHVAGCYSESEVQSSEKWTLAFPNAKTIWAYAGSAPKPGDADLAAWQNATRGRTDRLTESFVASRGTATAWSLNGGISHASKSLAERQQYVTEADDHFDAYFSGEARIANAHDPAADRDYAAYQMLAAHRDASAAERAHATERGAQMLRLRYWDASVRGDIARQYGAQINDALVKANLEPVDFGALSRREALAIIERYREVKGSLGPVMDGIVKLSPSVIPSTFVH